ncbi:MAG: hypothetical protein JO166_07200 [Deltaproteobacteria bacterium]|nr:hypothetical protein [Deltaproteobacteria bacterium]
MPPTKAHGTVAARFEAAVELREAPQSNALRWLQVSPPTPHRPVLGGSMLDRAPPIIEIDGGQGSEHQEYDMAQTVYLAEERLGSKPLLERADQRDRRRFDAVNAVLTDS